MVKFLVSVILFLNGVNSAMAKGNKDVGESKSAICAACHGPSGVSANDLWPNLAGQKEGYLAKQIRDFKSGARKDDLMSPIAQTLSEEDADHLAAYYSQLK